MLGKLRCGLRRSAVVVFSTRTLPSRDELSFDLRLSGNELSPDFLDYYCRRFDEVSFFCLFFVVLNFLNCSMTTVWALSFLRVMGTILWIIS